MFGKKKNNYNVYGTGGRPAMIVLDGKKQEVEIYALPATVGRNGEDVDVYLFDESISRMHCRFDYSQGAPIITDLYSTMGTKVEGTQLTPGQPYMLEDGCKIVIGKLKFKVRINHQAIMSAGQVHVQHQPPQQAPEPAQPAFSFDDNQPTDVQAPEYDYDSEITEPLIEEPEMPEAIQEDEKTEDFYDGEKTEVIPYSELEKAFQFPKKAFVDEDINEAACIIDKTPYTIGRSVEDNDAALNIRGLSRQHIKIEKVEEQFFVTDLNSTNGIEVNGEQIEPGVQVPINDGDRISIGDKEYRFDKY